MFHINAAAVTKVSVYPLDALVYHVSASYINVSECEKKGNFTHFLIKSLEPFKPGMNVYSFNILLHSRAPPTSSMGGASVCVDRVQKTPFYAPLWRLTTWDRKLAQSSNVGSLK